MVLKLKRRLRIVNTTGNPLDTRVEDADTGREIKGWKDIDIAIDALGITINVNVIAEFDVIAERGTVTHMRLDARNGKYTVIDAHD
jgi:hypothetical protein